MSDIKGQDLSGILQSRAQSQQQAKLERQEARVSDVPEKIQTRLTQLATEKQQARETSEDTTPRQNSGNRLSIEGRVTRHDSDTQYRVRTSEGEVVLKQDNPQQPLPPVTTQVQIDLPVTVQGQASAIVAEVLYRPASIPQPSVDLRGNQTPIEVNLAPTQNPSGTTTPATSLDTLLVQLEPVASTPAFLQSLISTPLLEEIIDLAPLNSFALNSTQLSALPALINIAEPENLLQAAPLNQALQLQDPGFALSEQAVPSSPVLPPHIQKLITQAEPILTGGASSDLQARASAAPLTHATALNQLLPSTIKQDSPASALHVSSAALIQPFSSSIETLQLRARSEFMQPDFIGSSFFKAEIHQPPLLLKSLKAGNIQAQLVGYTPEHQAILHVESAPSTQPPLLLYPDLNAFDLSQFSPSGPLFQSTDLPTHLPAGAPLTLEPLSLSPSSSVSIDTTYHLPDLKASQASAWADWGPILMQPGQWPAFEALNQALAATGQAALQQTLHQITPSSTNPTTLIPAALFFISAIKGNDLSSWLGDRLASALKNSKHSNALNRLGNEGSALHRLASDPSGDWKSWALPFLHQGEYQKILLHQRQYGHDQDDSASPGKDKMVRFVFDLTLTHIGNIQLDGLFHDGRKLDLILRSQQAFSQTMRMQMKQLFTKAIEPTGIFGELLFQNQPEQWVKINYQEQTLGKHA